MEVQSSTQSSKEFIKRNDDNNKCYMRHIVQQKEHIRINCGFSFYVHKIHKKFDE